MRRREIRLNNYQLGRCGATVENAQTALFLVSDDSSFVTRSTIVVGGAFTSK